MCVALLDVPGPALHLLPADRPQPGRPSCPGDCPHVQDGPAEVRVDGPQLDAEVRDGLTNAFLLVWAPLFPWICCWSYVSLIHLGSSYCIVVYVCRRPTIVAIHHSEVVGHASPICTCACLPSGRCCLVNVHRRR